MPEVHLWSLVPHTPACDDFASVIVLRRFPCIVGRHPTCDYRINNPMISRHHCALSLRDGRVWIEDLHSSNGTRLNGEPLQGARPLEDGDQLDLALLPFRVRLSEPAVPSPPEQRDVLVVDDDDAVARTLALLLQSWGHEVRVAHDGAEALQAVRVRPPDAVLLDVRLPGMDGFEVARRLRSEGGLEKARLVAITGDQGASDPRHSGEDGFAQLLVKPVDPQALREAITRPA
jgi:CheY-like chemotaxis protein